MERERKKERERKRNCSHCGSLPRMLANGLDYVKPRELSHRNNRNPVTSAITATYLGPDWHEWDLGMEPVTQAELTSELKACPNLMNTSPMNLFQFNLKNIH